MKMKVGNFVRAFPHGKKIREVKVADCGRWGNWIKFDEKATYWVDADGFEIVESRTIK